MTITHEVHRAGCSCDRCIQFRVKQKIAAREAEAASRPYIQRRGADIGKISVSDALKQTKR